MCFGGRPFPHISDHVVYTVLSGASRERAHVCGTLFLIDVGTSIFPRVSPRKERTLRAVTRRKLPFFFRGQAVLHSIALRNPRCKVFRIFDRNVDYGPTLTAHRWIVTVPRLPVTSRHCGIDGRRRPASLLNELG